MIPQVFLLKLPKIRCSAGCIFAYFPQFCVKGLCEAASYRQITGCSLPIPNTLIGSQSPRSETALSFPGLFPDIPNGRCQELSKPPSICKAHILHHLLVLLSTLVHCRKEMWLDRPSSKSCGHFKQVASCSLKPGLQHSPEDRCAGRGPIGTRELSLASLSHPWLRAEAGFKSRFLSHKVPH